MAMHSADSAQTLLRLSTAQAATASTTGRVRLSRDQELEGKLEVEVVGLFDQHRVRLLAYVAAIGVDGHDGEEIVQEVFLALFCHLRMGKSRSNLRGWIFRVAHNLALRQREADQLRLLRIQAGRDTDHEADKAPAQTLNPEEQLLAAQRQSRLLSVVSALPESDRLCFNLRAEGLRYREIAQILGISLGSVSMSLTRTVARLMRADEGRRESVR